MPPRLHHAEKALTTSEVSSPGPAAGISMPAASVASGSLRRSNAGRRSTSPRGGLGSAGPRGAWSTRNLEDGFKPLREECRTKDFRVRRTLCVSWNHRKRQRWYATSTSPSTKTRFSSPQARTTARRLSTGNVANIKRRTSKIAEGRSSRQDPSSQGVTERWSTRAKFAAQPWTNWKQASPTTVSGVATPWPGRWIQKHSSFPT
mmetsp:Transcript_77135/g.173083  ORF Transcript_77135/g.173083 Transcript_77135/m.173083 type:complete len:204 (-) Transcript_77135:314-925(-)